MKLLFSPSALFPLIKEIELMLIKVFEESIPICFRSSQTNGGYVLKRVS
jgi:hypothetical protein